MRSVFTITAEILFYFFIICPVLFFLAHNCMPFQTKDLFLNIYHHLWRHRWHWYTLLKRPTDKPVCVLSRGDCLLAYLLRPWCAQTQTSGRYWTFKNKNNVLGAPVDWKKLSRLQWSDKKKGKVELSFEWHKSVRIRLMPKLSYMQRWNAAVHYA